MHLEEGYVRFSRMVFKVPLGVGSDVEEMLIIIFLSLSFLVGQAIPRIFSITSVISNCESDNQNCFEGKSIVKNFSQTMRFHFFH